MAITFHFEITSSPILFWEENNASTLMPSSFLFPGENGLNNNDDEVVLGVFDYVWYGLGWAIRIFVTLALLVCIVRSIRIERVRVQRSPGEIANDEEEDNYSEETRLKIINSMLEDHNTAVLNHANGNYDIESNTLQYYNNNNIGTSKQKLEDTRINRKKAKILTNKKLNTTTATTTPATATLTSCSICLEKFITNDEIVILNASCSHVFHKDCLVEWARQKSKNTECPMCRQLMWDPNVYRSKLEKEQQQKSEVEGNNNNNMDYGAAATTTRQLESNYHDDDSEEQYDI